ncbi:LLM class F420-dependent oxidoreductase [Microtetraspora sp. NBRC 13810]|uniref:TIGR03620 family F420-dependent LLM class oxidoreductase n=1 Tax=Microtetraspora sp. NBRC 13810 TaxID=3030990 RepID=UPI0024A3B69A|nr:TIGR03620 family F420-dependent LLM class oxidoreductase [Microtetraspora sp. NBRC 13810]GLW09338.1 LLM class F420-dependent oxidoreductase [Microtetraspora sp. NBRC 13810]
MSIGRIGVWHPLFGRAPVQAVRQAAAEIEGLGYQALWFGESFGSREAFTTAAILLAATDRIAVGSGIASIWARDATATAAGAAALGEAYPGRFALGIGVSHAPLVNVRGHEYGRPLAAMDAYLDAMAAARPSLAMTADPPVPTLLAALRPRMLELSRDKADGAHPYFVPPEHTALARKILGAGPTLAPEQAVLLETDPAKARQIAREHMSLYLTLPNYLNNLRHLGFGDDDLADGGSDRLVDAIVAWGDADKVAARVREHFDAGADHVAVQPLPTDLGGAVTQLAELAPVLGVR